MDTIKIGEFEYRIKKMNAIETLALRSQYRADATYEETANFYNTVLERMEVNAGKEWLPVKTPGKDIYYPAGIENDIAAIEKLILHFVQHITEVFQKSNESKETTK